MTNRELQYLQNRTADQHLAFLRDFLCDGSRILDCGCGPGVLTNDLAGRYPTSTLAGIDVDSAMIDAARQSAAQNVIFECASVYGLPFQDSFFDVAYANALFQHLEKPTQAFSEMLRVVRPGGVIAIRVPDWSGLLMHPSTVETKQALARFLSIHYGDKKDPYVGCKLPSYALELGLKPVAFTVDHETSDPRSMFRNIAEKLEAAGFHSESVALSNAAETIGALFVQSWCELVARK